MSNELIAILGVILAAIVGALSRRRRGGREIARKAREAREEARAAESKARARAEAVRRERLDALEEERRRIARADDDELARMLDQ